MNELAVPCFIWTCCRSTRYILYNTTVLNLTDCIPSIYTWFLCVYMQCRIWYIRENIKGDMLEIIYIHHIQYIVHVLGIIWSTVHLILAVVGRQIVTYIWLIQILLFSHVFPNYKVPKPYLASSRNIQLCISVQNLYRYFHQ